MLKRPSKDDTEEDILKFQEEFLASKTTPAVSVLKTAEKRKTADETSKRNEKSKRDVVDLGIDIRDPSSHHAYRQPPEKKKIKFENPQIAADLEEDNAEERLERHDHHITKVLSDIVERDFKSPPVYYPSAPTHGGFPRVLHRGANLDVQDKEGNKGPKKKMSLFAQQFMKNKKEFGVDVSQTRGENVLGDVIERKSTQHANIITGQGLNARCAQDEVSSIHQENVSKLSSMSEEDILTEQARLMSTLEPSLVEFLKNRKAKKAPTSTLDPESSSNMEEQSKSKASSTGTESSMETEKKENTPIEEQDLPIKPNKEWVNMDKIEYEKMEWMKTVKTPKTDDSNTGQSARFDFQGHLVASDAEIPVHHGLHHHGKDPDKAGYTLEELFMLCRSSNMQQRVIALNTLANIVVNARKGEFRECTSAYIIPALQEGGLIFINRWALDDSTDNTMAAAVNLLHKILVFEEDEKALDDTFHWYQGHLNPRLCPVITEDEYDENGDKIEKTDADVVKSDLVMGLIRMSILPRLRFILHKWHPPASVVIQTVEILTRIARHSTQAAYQISQCAGLVETLVKEFLPCHWKTPGDLTKPITNAYGYPLPKVLKLIRILCASSRNIAASILDTHGLMSVITRYICEGVSLQLPAKEAHALITESFRMWQVCACYGLGISNYESMYPVLMERVQALVSTVNLTQYSSDCNSIDLSVITLLESIMQVAASVTFERGDQRMRQAEALSGGESCTTRALPPIDWSQVVGFSEVMVKLMENEIKFFTDFYFEKPFDLSRISGVINFVASYITLVDSQPGYNAVEALDIVENLSTACLLPCIKSKAFYSVARYLREKSVLLLQMKGTRGEATPNLPEVGSVCGDKAESCPVLDTKSTVNFLVCFTRLLLSICKLHKGLVEKLLPEVLKHEEMLQYVRKMCLWQKKALLTANYLSKFENQLQFNLVTMCRLVMTTSKDTIDSKLYHQLALYLLMHLHQGNEYLAHSLLSSVIFNGDFMGDISTDGLASFNEALQLEEEKYLKSATTQEIKKAQSDLIKDSCSNLTVIRNSYLQAVSGLVVNLHRSRNCSLPKPLDVDSLQIGDVSQLLVPVDWPFLPLIELYNKTMKRNTAGSKEKSANKTVTEDIVINTLRWVYVVECWRPGLLDSVSLTMKLSRLMCVFLAEADLFFNANIHGYLLSLIKIYCKAVNLDRTNLEEKVPGLASFYDLYLLLLNQYEAVSFGDPLFAGYVLLPQQQKHEVKYRKLLWGEQVGVLEALTLPLDQVIVPIKSFLEPEESNLALLRLYFQALYSGTISQQRNPLPYLIAVHHVNRFLYTQDGKNNKLKEAFIKQGVLCKNKILRSHIFHYKLFNIDCLHGMEMYDSLPSSRKQLLESFDINPVNLEKLS